MLNYGLDDGDHMDRRSRCHFRQRSEKKQKKATGRRENDRAPRSDMAEQVVEVRRSHPSVFAQSRLGPRTMAMLLGVILLMSLSCASLAKNFTRYLQESLSLSVPSMIVANGDGCTALSFCFFKMETSD